MSDRLTVLHTSDFQCGKPYLPEAAKALLALAEDIDPDVVIVSGDLTQRAKKGEFVIARSIIDGFGARPVVVTPGNHDVPLYRIWERLFDPFGNWRSFAGARALDTVTTVDGAIIVSLNSAAPLRAIVNGRVDDCQVDFARQAFEAGERDALRLLVVHHNFVPAPSKDAGRPLPRAAYLASAFGDMGVDLILGGHVHETSMKVSEEIPECPPQDPPLPILACGTTTSLRGRGSEDGWNSLSVLRFGEDDVEVTPYRRAVGSVPFEPMPSRSWRLRGRV